MNVDIDLVDLVFGAGMQYDCACGCYAEIFGPVYLGFFLCFNWIIKT